MSQRLKRIDFNLFLVYEDHIRTGNVLSCRHNLFWLLFKLDLCINLFSFDWFTLEPRKIFNHNKKKLYTFMNH